MKAAIVAIPLLLSYCTVAAHVLRKPQSLQKLMDPNPAAFDPEKNTRPLVQQKTTGKDEMHPAVEKLQKVTQPLVQPQTAMKESVEKLGKVLQPMVGKDDTHPVVEKLEKVTQPLVQKETASKDETHPVVKQLKQMAKPLVENAEPLVEKLMPVEMYIPSKDEMHPVEMTKVMHKFSVKQLTEMNYAGSHGLHGAQCTPANTIFDLGFYDGADSKAYLSGGYCVVGVEADPDMANEALTHFAPYVATGQLRVANLAIAPSDKTPWTVFYKNKCSKEWNSFIKTVGCRACLPPHSVDDSACEAVQVTATDCGGVFSTFGIPGYLKLDIEGAEMGCFQAMKKFNSTQTKPWYVSAEITQMDYIDTLHSLGYKGFKLVRQDRLATAVGSTTGPWGENALDCATGPQWRDLTAIKQEWTTIMAKDLVLSEACPGGIMPIHSEPKMAAAYMWYDLHATLGEPLAAAR